MANSGYTILIIDDSASDRRIYRRFLTGQSLYELNVLETVTGQAGLDACEQQQPECIILDYQLPDEDGLAVLDKLKLMSSAPVVFITGKPEPLVVTEAYRRGATRCISKDTVTSIALQEAVFDALELTY